MARDYYQTLGVAKDASNQDIKRAYRKVFDAGTELLRSSATLEHTAQTFVDTLQERYDSREAFREMTELKATTIQTGEAISSRR
jgi:hypothetical protein